MVVYNAAWTVHAPLWSSEKAGKGKMHRPSGYGPAGTLGSPRPAHQAPYLKQWGGGRHEIRGKLERRSGGPPRSSAVMSKRVTRGNPLVPKHALRDAIRNKTTREHEHMRTDGGRGLGRRGEAPTQPGSSTRYQANHHIRNPKHPTGQCHGRGFSDRIETHFHGRPFRNTSLHRFLTDPTVSLNQRNQVKHKRYWAQLTHVIRYGQRYLCFVSLLTQVNRKSYQHLLAALAHKPSLLCVCLHPRLYPCGVLVYNSPQVYVAPVV